MFDYLVLTVKGDNLCLKIYLNNEGRQLYDMIRLNSFNPDLFTVWQSCIIYHLGACIYWTHKQWLQVKQHDLSCGYQHNTPIIYKMTCPKTPLKKSLPALSSNPDPDQENIGWSVIVPVRNIEILYSNYSRMKICF